MIKRITTASKTTVEIESSNAGVRLRRLGGVRMHETSPGAADQLAEWRWVRSLRGAEVGRGLIVTFEDGTFYSSTPIVKIEEIA